MSGIRVESGTLRGARRDDAHQLAERDEAIEIGSDGAPAAMMVYDTDNADAWIQSDRWLSAEDGDVA